MTPHRTAFLAIVLLSSTLFAQENLNDLVRDLAGDKPTQLTGDKLDAAYAKALDLSLADLASDDANKVGNAQSAIERIAFVASRPNAETERAALSKAIAAKVAAAPAAAKPWLIRQLQRIGRAEAVPALAKLLGDADANVRESARRALQQNPAPEAGEALRAAFASAEGPWRIALLNALAGRFEAANLAVLLKEVAGDSDELRIAALRGLGRLGNKSAAPAIAAAMGKGSPLSKQVATDAYLTLAETLCMNGDNAAALEIYLSLLASPGHLKCAGIIGIGRCGSVTNLPVVFESAAEPDAKLRGACVEAMALMQGNDVTPAIVAKLKSAAEAKPTLLQGLARRSDKSTLSVFVAACDDADEATRIEAIRGVGLLGDASSVPLLLKIAAAGGPTLDAARWSLAQLTGTGIDQAVLTATGDADAKVRLEAIRATVARHIEAAAPALLKAAEDSKSPTRIDSIKALGSLAPTESLAAVAALVIKAEDDAVRNEAANALASIAGREADADKRCDAILAALSGSTGPAKVALLRILPRVGGPKSLAAVRDAVKDANAPVKDAGIRALADWQDISACEDLLAIAKSASTEAHHVLALRGCIRIARETRDKSSAERGKLLIAALDTARRPDEKRQAISALSDVRNADALQAVMACLGDKALAQESAQAAARIGREIANDKPELVKEAMPKVIEATKNEDVQRQAKEAIDRAEQKLKQKK